MLKKLHLALLQPKSRENGATENSQKNSAYSTRIGEHDASFPFLIDATLLYLKNKTVLSKQFCKYVNAVLLVALLAQGKSKVHNITQSFSTF